MGAQELADATRFQLMLVFELFLAEFVVRFG